MDVINTVMFYLVIIFDATNQFLLGDRNIYSIELEKTPT